MFFQFPKIQLLLDQGRHAEAESAIREELRESGMENPFLFFLLGVALLSQNKPKEAENAARESLKIEGDYDLGFFMLSRALLAQEKKREALAAVDEALKIDPEDADYFAQKAQIYLDWNKFKDALKASEAGLAVDPDNEGCRFIRSICLERLGRYDEADAESLGLLSEDPEDAENHAARGWVLAQRGDHQGAERHFVEALRINPNSDDARAGLAFAFKLRNPLLGWILKSLIWIERIPFWWVIIGMIVVFRFVDKIADSNQPAPIPQIATVIRIVMWMFILLSLIIHPLFNIVLLSSKTARHALSNDERRGAKWAIAPLIIAGLYCILWIIKGGSGMPPIFAMVWASIGRMLYEIFETHNPWVRRWLGGITFAAFSFTAWITYYTYAIYLPQVFDAIKVMTELIRELGEAPTNEERREAIEPLIELRKSYNRMVIYPSLAIWMFAAFFDDVREFFTRRAPD